MPVKPALYYAMRRDIYNNIVAVTTEKPGWRGKWHGRYTRDNTPTHGTFDDLMGRFETQEAAEAKRDELKAIRAKYYDERKRLNDMQRDLYHRETAEINAACENV